jgi:transposase
MLSFPGNTRVYLCAAAVDLRKGFDGLCGLVETVFQQDVLDGHLFLFVNKRRDRLKALWWDRDGLAIFYKRLERGTFEAPRVGGEVRHLELDATQLAMLLGGVSLEGARRRKRFRTAS